MPTTHAAVASALILALQSTGQYARLHYGKEQVAIEPGEKVAVLSEQEEEVLGQSADRTVTIRQPYILEITSECDPENPRLAAHANADQALSAVFSDKSLKTLDSLLSSHVANRYKLAYTGRVVLPRQEGQILVTVQVKLNACFVIQLV